MEYSMAEKNPKSRRAEVVAESRAPDIRTFPFRNDLRRTLLAFSRRFVVQVDMDV
jgi:hypothetical protein